MFYFFRSTISENSLDSRTEHNGTVFLTEIEKKLYKTLFSSTLIPYDRLKIGDSIGEGMIVCMHML